MVRKLNNRNNNTENTETDNTEEMRKRLLEVKTILERTRNGERIPNEEYRKLIAEQEELKKALKGKE